MGIDLVPAQLYLDTARLGLMSPSAQFAQMDFARFSGEAPGSLYFDQLLDRGFAAWPASLRRRYSRLHCWPGLAGIKNRIRKVTGATSSSRVLLANRSSELMRLTARLMFAECKTVLTTDLSWPNYQRILQTEARRVGARLLNLKLRHSILIDKMSAKEVVTRVESAVAQFRCHGLFVPIVDNLGIQLPVRDIAVRLRQSEAIRFLAVDGAQTLAHVPVELESLGCDVFLAGCHKWVRAYNPMGLAVLANLGSQAKLAADTRDMVATRVIDDPLLRMTTELESGSLSRSGETVNLLPLFTCAGALNDLSRDKHTVSSALEQRLKNGDRLHEIADDNWRSVVPAQEMRSGIHLLAGRTKYWSHVTAKELRRRLHDAHISLTTYPHGYVRASMPCVAWSKCQKRILSEAFNRRPIHAR